VVGVTRRPAHGATRRPPFERPGNGFGRPLRPGPPARWRDVEALVTTAQWDPIELLLAADAGDGVGWRPTTVDDATITL
jgi:hypothetical protein